MAKNGYKDYSNWNVVGDGSSGYDVGQVQAILKKNGYDIDVDKIYGDQTKAAIMDYQKKNGLTVDGIVGAETWASFMGDKTTPSNSGSTNQSAPSFSYNDFSHGAYQESDIVKNAYAALQQQANNAPGAYQSKWQDQISSVMDKILNREDFSYDLNSDALYQQYAEQYARQGKMAMQDTMGQAAAMTGGYGNSYAATAGNQAYQAYLQELNDVVPELHQMAYEKYLQEGQDLLNHYAILGEQENIDYGRYRDSISDYYTERDYLANRYDAERDYDYSKYIDGRDFAYGKYSDDKAYAYQNHQDQVAYEKWLSEFTEQQRQYDETMAFNKDQANKPTSSGGGGTSEKPFTMSTEDFAYWSDAFSGVTSVNDAQALRDQMVIAVGDPNMAYELYYQWERKNLTSGTRTNTTVYRGANGQTHMLN